MVTPRRVAPYPWQTLERVPRGIARRSGEIRRRLARAAGVGRLAPALGELLGSELVIALRDVRPAPALRHRHPCRIGLQLADGTGQITVEIEPALATAALARLLGRSVAVGPSGAPVDPALAGALAALVVEAARRTGGSVPLRATAPTAELPADAVALLATVVLDGRPYDATAIAEVATLAGDSPPLSALGDLRLGLGLIVAAAAFERQELAALGPGDAWLAATGWWIDRQLVGRGVLAPPAGECGIAVELRNGGAMVVRGFERIAIEVDTMAEDVSVPLADVALDAPLVVRVELGAVSMTAREWAELRPGDVIETRHRIAEPVTLRIAGQVVARGELVDVEGELGVRVRELVARGDGA